MSFSVSEEVVMNLKSRSRLSDANLEIMKLAWQRGEVTINEVLEAINTGRKRKLKRATIQVQMRRLEKYGWLRHRQVNREFYYAPARGEEDAKKNILSHVRDRVFGGSHAELVRYLFSGSPVPPEEVNRIKKLLEECERK
jgi:BlaI family penicillinase repressor